jgi:hypothetical protein
MNNWVTSGLPVPFQCAFRIGCTVFCRLPTRRCWYRKTKKHSCRRLRSALAAIRCCGFGRRQRKPDGNGWFRIRRRPGWGCRVILRTGSRSAGSGAHCFCRSPAVIGGEPLTLWTSSEAVRQIGLAADRRHRHRHRRCGRGRRVNAVALPGAGELVKPLGKSAPPTRRASAHAAGLVLTALRRIGTRRLGHPVLGLGTFHRLHLAQLIFGAVDGPIL